MTNSTNEQRIEIARRVLRNSNGASVQLILYAPVLRSEADGGWSCRGAILEDDRQVEFENPGIDSLQALALAMGWLRAEMKQRGLKRFSWLEMEGQTGLPLVIQELDENFQALMEHIKDAELLRQGMWQKDLREAHPNRDEGET